MAPVPMGLAVSRSAGRQGHKYAYPRPLNAEALRRWDQYCHASAPLANRGFVTIIHAVLRYRPVPPAVLAGPILMAAAERALVPPANLVIHHQTNVLVVFPIVRTKHAGQMMAAAVSVQEDHVHHPIRAAAAGPPISADVRRRLAQP
jgi:hypothetical protein